MYILYKNNLVIFYFANKTEYMCFKKEGATTTLKASLRN